MAHRGGIAESEADRPRVETPYAFRVRTGPGTTLDIIGAAYPWAVVRVGPFARTDYVLMQALKM